MEEARRLLHEAELRQVDLEAQNEELRAALELLEASREYYFDLYEMAPVGYLQIDQSGLILQANRAAALLLGLDRSQLKDQWFSRLIGDDDLISFGLMQTKLARTRQAQSRELRMHKKDGTPLWVNLSIEAHTKPRGEFLHIVLIDVTQRKQAQSALRESQERFRTLAESTSEAIMVHCDGQILYVNPAALRICGARSAMEMLGKPVMDRVHPDFRASVTERLSNLMRDKVGVAVAEIRLLRLDGATRDVEIRGGLIHYGDRTAVQISIRDVTEQRQLEQRQRIAAAAFECQECMLVLDAQRAILRVNRAFSQVSGYAEHEVVGKSSALLSSVQHAQDSYDTIWSEIASTGCWKGKVWHRHKDGSHYLAQGGTTAVLDEHAKVSHYVINFIDASRRQQDEHQRITDESEHRDALVREVHHRIKNHLQGVMSLLRRFATKHPETAKPLREAIAQVQSISVIHGLKAQETMARISVAELTGAVAREIQDLWQTPITLALCDDAARWSLHEDDAVPIALVINELIANAVKHGGQAADGVSVALNPGSRTDALQLCISNAGVFSQAATSGFGHSGLKLIAALMPRRGARLTREQRGTTVVTLLELEPPVVFIGSHQPSTSFGELDLD